MVKILLASFFYFLLVSNFVAQAFEQRSSLGCGEMEVWDYSTQMCMPFPMAGMPMKMAMLHGNFFLAKIWEQGPRGREAVSAPNMFMADLGSSASDNQYLNLDFMGTLDKWSTPRQGYPELLQIGEGDSVLALLKCEEVLMNSRSTKQEKQYALEFMVHFTGDIHQPLHAGHPDDKGGNTIDVDWFGVKTNLHAVWDAKMIETYYKDKIDGQDLPTQGKTLADILDNATTKQVNEWTSVYVNTWLNESLTYRKEAYASGYLRGQPAYLKKNIEIVNLRLKQAGYRLAYWLNAIFSKGATLSADGVQLRSDLRAILGSQMDSIVDLTPHGSPSQADLMTFATYSDEMDDD